MPLFACLYRPPEFQKTGNAITAGVREGEIPELQSLDPGRHVGFNCLNGMGRTSIRDDMAHHARMAGEKDGGSGCHGICHDADGVGIKGQGPRRC